jgi:hypothetical protein
MKRILISALVLLAFAVTANAEIPQKKGQMPPQQKMMCPGMMQGGQMPMMQHMMAHGMMMRDMMHMIRDMMEMQKRMLSEMTPNEKKEVTKELDRMMDRMEKMMSGMMEMMMKGVAEPAPALPEKKETPAPDQPHRH